MRLSALAAVLLLAGPALAEPPITKSPPMTKGTGLPLEDGEGLPLRAGQEPPPALAGVTGPELSAALPGGSSCTFSSDGGTVLAANADRQAVAKPDGALLAMLYEGPELRAGGYFTAGAITIVVEPDAAASRAVAGGTEWAAAIVVDRAGRNVRHAGTWRCNG